MYVRTPMLHMSAGMSNNFPFNVSGAILKHTVIHRHFEATKAGLEITYNF